MNINIKRFSSITLVLMPWLTCYKFLVNGLTIGDFLLIVALSLNILRDIKRKSVSNTNNPKVWIILIIYYVFSIFMLMFISFNGDINSYNLVIKRTIKMGLYFFTVAYLVSRCMDYCYFEKMYKKIVYISCGAILVQYVFYYLFGRYVECKIPFLSYSNEIVEKFDFAESRLYSFRPDSIFLEPSHFIYFIIGYIIICLVKNNNPRIKEAILITLCGLMSKSSSGIFFLIVIWMYFILITLYNRKTKSSKKIKILASVFIFITLISIIYFNSSLSESIERLNINSNPVAAGNVWYKINIGDEYTESLLGIKKIVGAGLGNYDKGIFCTTINFVYYCTGLIGLIIIISWIIISFLKGNNVGKLMIICTLMLFFAWYLIYAPLFVFYNVIIVNNIKRSKK